MDDRANKSSDSSGLVMISDDLSSRPTRVPDFATESVAYASIANEIAQSPDSAPQRVVTWIRKLCRAESAGIALLESSGDRQVFRYAFVEGPFAANAGHEAKGASPFAQASQQRETLFLTHVNDQFRNLSSFRPSIRECLLAPIWIDNRPVGVAWAFQHTTIARFDSEDARLMGNLARHAAIALRMIQSSSNGHEARIARLLKHLKDYAIFMLDPNGIVTEWTEGAGRVLGYAPEEVLGKHFSMFFTSQDVAGGEPQRELSQAAALGRAEYDAWRVHRTGQYIWMNVILSSILDDQGQLIGFAKISRDLTERRRIEEEREHFKRRLSYELHHMVRLHEMSTRLMQSGDLSLVLKEVLDAIIDLQGADRGHVQLYDAKDASLMVVAQRGFSTEFMESLGLVSMSDDYVCSQAARSRRRVLVEDLQAPGLPDRLRQVSELGDCRAVQSSPIVDHEGVLVGVLSTHFREPHRLSDRDLRLTDAYLRLAAETIVKVRYEQKLRSAQRAAERANQSKTRFLATASHDLRQPLQTLSLLNGSLRRMVANSPAARVVTEQQQAIAAISSLLNALLDISKLESGAVKPEIIDFDLQSLNESLRTEFAALADKKGLEFRTFSAAVWVHSDPVLLAQIIRNLVGNAIRYTRQGWVELRVIDASNYVRVEVADSGIGIPETLIPNIFEEFYQVGVQAHATREGHGLGLNIVQRTARLLGHPLEVQSEVGKGSVFSLTLPKGVPQVQFANVASDREDDKRAKPQVLIVDDEPSVLLATKLLLELEGYHVLEAQSLSGALQVAKENPNIGLLLSDYHLSNDELGTAVIDQVRGALGHRIGAVLMSGDTSRAMSKILLDDSTRIARKPIDSDELLGILKSLCK